MDGSPRADRNPTFSNNSKRAPSDSNVRKTLAVQWQECGAEATGDSGRDITTYAYHILRCPTFILDTAKSRAQGPQDIVPYQPLSPS
jgi:hypothetical protein